MDESRPSERLLAALRGALGALPPALGTFDALAGEGPTPDFFEWSARISSDLETARLTYYFDAEKHSAEALATVGDRFAVLAEALGVKLPPPLLAVYREEVPGNSALLQVVLGIDGRTDGLRLKLYVIMKAAAPALVDALLGAVSCVRPPSLDASRVYILGLDFGGEGLLDAKLYYRLEIARLPRVVANLAEVGDLYRATREVVLQRCLLNDRSQLYLHATDERAIARYLERRTGRATARLLEVQRSLGEARIAPWIISFAFRDHRLQLGESNVYFHLGG